MRGFFNRKAGPLPYWSIAAVAAGIGGYVWWQRRQAGAAGGDTADDSATPGASAIDNGVPTTDYGEGFDYGMLAAQNAGGNTTGQDDTSDGSGDAGTQAATAHNRIKYKVKNPAGHMETVYGYGTWKKQGGHWIWTAVLPSNINAFSKPYNQPAGGDKADNDATTVKPVNRQKATHGSSGKVHQGSQVAYQTPMLQSGVAA